MAQFLSLMPLWAHGSYGCTNQWNGRENDVNCSLGALKQFITFAPCHRDPRKTCGDQVFIAWVPRVYAGRTSQGRKKIKSCAFKTAEIRGGCLLPWHKAVCPGWLWVIFLSSRDWFTLLECQPAAPWVGKMYLLLCVQANSLFPLLPVRVCLLSPPFFLGAKFISDLFSLLGLYNFLFSKAIFSGSILPWRK